MVQPGRPVNAHSPVVVFVEANNGVIGANKLVFLIDFARYATSIMNGA